MPHMVIGRIQRDFQEKSLKERISLAAISYFIKNNDELKADFQGRKKSYAERRDSFEITFTKNRNSAKLRGGFLHSIT